MPERSQISKIDFPLDGNQRKGFPPKWRKKAAHVDA